VWRQGVEIDGTISEQLYQAAATDQGRAHAFTDGGAHKADVGEVGRWEERYRTEKKKGRANSITAS
jgi:hypothetical protein